VQLRRSKDQIDQHKFSMGHKSLICCTVIWKKILERQLIVPEVSLLQHFSAIEKALMGQKCDPQAIWCADLFDTVVRKSPRSKS